MRNTQNWKHTTKNRKQYGTNKVTLWYDPVKEVRRSKRDTPFMDLSDIKEEDE